MPRSKLTKSNSNTKTKKKNRKLKRSSSLPNRSKSRMVSSDSSEERNRIAQLHYGRFKEPHEIEMKHLNFWKKSYPQYITMDGKVRSDVPLHAHKEVLQFLLDKEEKKKTYALEKTREIMEKPLKYDKVEFDDFPAYHNDPLPLLEMMDCKDRLNWCMTQPPGTCARGTLFETKYTYSCKIYDYVKKRIDEDITGINRRLPHEEYLIDVVENMEDIHENILNLPFKNYITAFSSFGNGIREFSFHVKCDFLSNYQTGILSKCRDYTDGDVNNIIDLIEELIDYVEYFEATEWTEAEFVGFTNEFLDQDFIDDVFKDNLGVSSFKYIYEEMQDYKKGSFHWWIIALNGELLIVPTVNTAVSDEEKYGILEEFLHFDQVNIGLSSGMCFQNTQLPFGDLDRLILGSSKVQNLLYYFKYIDSRRKAHTELISLMEHMKDYGKRIQKENLVADFLLELVKLLSFEQEEWSKVYNYNYKLTKDIETILKTEKDKKISESK